LNLAEEERNGSASLFLEREILENKETPSPIVLASVQKRKKAKNLERSLEVSLA
jgi:hypothetical protein